MSALLTACATAAALFVAPGDATSQHIGLGPRYRVRATKISKGLVFYRIRDRKGPNQIRVLEVDPRSNLTIDVELANDRIPGHERTSSMASRRKAVAAINGDYTLRPSDEFAGRPVHTFAEDARLVTSPLLFGRNFALAQDESIAFVGHPRFRAELRQADSGEVWRINGWNDAPSTETFTVLSPEGGRAYRPPRNACSARLFPEGPVTWGEGQVGISQNFTVDEVKCGPDRLWRRGGFIVTSLIGGKKALKILESIMAGESVRLSWTTGWPGIVDTIGGNPSLMENGVVTADNCTGSYFCDRNPRTGMGITDDGKILLVTVDGRQPGWSVGLRILAFAKLMRRLGATSALNLDGGGSTTMWLQGKIKNRISDSTERAVGSSILVLPGTDFGEPIPYPFPGPPPASPSPTPTSSPTPTPTATPSPTPTAGVADSPALDLAPRARPVFARDSCASLHDPASIGGLLDMIERTRPVAARAFSPMLRRALEVFRDERSCRSFFRFPPR